MNASRQQATRRGAAAGGFALIEVLVSLTLLAVGIVGVLSAVLAALDLQQDAAMRYRAGLILQDKLSETLLVPYGGETARGVSADGLFSWTIIGAPWQGLTQAAERTRPEADGAEDADRLYEIRVEVSWETGAGIRRLNATQLVSMSPGVEVVP